MYGTLTEGQRSPLFGLVRYQREAGRELVFRTDAGWDVSIRPWDEGEGTPTIMVKIPKEYLNVWAQAGHIIGDERLVGMSAAGVRTFVLSGDALDYERLMSKCAFRRNCILLWRKLVDDIPSLIWGLIGGILGGVTTALLVDFLTPPLGLG